MLTLAYAVFSLVELLVSLKAVTGLALALASSLFFWNNVDFYELLQPTNQSGMRELTD